MGDTYDDYQGEGRVSTGGMKISGDDRPRAARNVPTLLELEGRFGEAVERLADVITQHQEKLSPITRPQDDGGMKRPSDEEGGGQSELFNRLARHLEALQAQTYRILDTTAGVQL